MSTRINAIRVIYKKFDDWGVYIGNSVVIYMTPTGAASGITNLRAWGDQRKFVSVEVGNRKSWVSYDIELDWSTKRIAKALENAMEMQLAFYDEGEVT